MSVLKELSEARGVSGHEDEVRKLIYAKVRDLVDEVHVDALGNLITLRKARTTAEQPVPKKVLVAAHMDEVGLMITRIEKNGLLSFYPVGGIDPRVLLAKRVLVGDRKVPGVIGSKPIHLLKPAERERVARYDEMSIDIGTASESAAQRLVSVGDYATFDTTFEELDGVAKGKAFDDRAGCGVLIGVLQGEYPFDLYAAFTAQEEAGLRGARVVTFGIEPDCAIVLEGTIADDLPKKKDESPTTEVGKGPAITRMDRSFIPHRGLLRHILDVAEQHGIPYQFKQPGIGGTDAGAIHLSREGVPSAAVSVPCRYVHSPVAMLSLKDFDYTVTLVRETLRTLTADHLGSN